MSDGTKTVLVLIGIVLMSFMAINADYGLCAKKYGTAYCDDMNAREAAFE